MNTTVRKIMCPRCAYPCELNSFHHSETQELIEATYCEKCNASYARHRAHAWRLIKQFSDGEGER